MFVPKEKIKTCLQDLINIDSTRVWDSRGITLLQLKRTLVDRENCPFSNNGCEVVCAKLFPLFKRFYYDKNWHNLCGSSPCGCYVARVADFPIENFDYILEYMITLLETGEVKNEKTGKSN